MDKWDRLYLYLNDWRFAVAPDETTPEEDRHDRELEREVLDGVMKEMEKLDEDRAETDVLERKGVSHSRKGQGVENRTPDRDKTVRRPFRRIL